MVDLAESRRKIDEIDKEIAALFLERMKISGDVADYKAATGKLVYDPVREEEKLNTVEDFTQTPFHKKALREFFSFIMSISRKYQYHKLKKNISLSPLQSLPFSEKVGFYGGVGSYTELAMKDFFGSDITGTPYPDFASICLALESGACEYGVLPIENSGTRSISDIYELLSEHRLFIVGELIKPLDHALLGMKGSALTQITDIFTHPEPILQCSSFLCSLKGVKTHAFGSTSMSASMIKEAQNPHFATIASERKASFYDLDVLAKHIADDPNNATRFIIIAKEPFLLTNADKITLCFDIPHKSGSLYHLLSHFIHNNVNMTSIESRSIPDKRWAYRFFVEVDGNLTDEHIQNALRGIEAESFSFLILGNYVSTHKK